MSYLNHNMPVMYKPYSNQTYSTPLLRSIRLTYGICATGISIKGNRVTKQSDNLIMHLHHALAIMYDIF